MGTRTSSTSPGVHHQVFHYKHEQENNTNY